jgi:hypothetical protein
LITALAVSIHSFAIMGIFVYLIPKIKHLLVFMWVILILSFLIGISGGVGNLLFNFVGFKYGSIFPRMLNYLNDSNYTQDGGMFRGIFLQYLCISLFILLLYKRLVKKFPFNKILIPIFICGFAFMLVIRDFGILVARIKNLFCMTTEIIFIPSSILIFRKRERIIPLAAIVGYCILWFLLNSTYAVSMVGPYESILQFLP